MRRIVTCGLVIACAVPIARASRRRARRAAIPAQRRRSQPARFDVGAGVESITPPLAGKPAHDPALCTSNPAYNGPHYFAFEEPVRRQPARRPYDVGDPYVDCNQRWPLGRRHARGRRQFAALLNHVADPVSARALVVSNGRTKIAVEVVDNEGLFNVFANRIRAKVAADGYHLTASSSRPRTTSRRPTPSASRASTSMISGSTRTTSLHRVAGRARDRGRTLRIVLRRTSATPRRTSPRTSASAGPRTRSSTTN